jgi:hypothetical protein
MSFHRGLSSQVRALDRRNRKRGRPAGIKSKGDYREVALAFLAAACPPLAFVIIPSVAASERRQARRNITTLTQKIVAGRLPVQCVSCQSWISHLAKFCTYCGFRNWRCEDCSTTVAEGKQLCSICEPLRNDPANEDKFIRCLSCSLRIGGLDNFCTYCGATNLKRWSTARR